MVWWRPRGKGQVAGSKWLNMEVEEGEEEEEEEDDN